MSDMSESQKFFAGIDCGTNSIRLLITDQTGKEQYRATRIIRLGQDVDHTHRIAQAALERLTRVLTEYVSSMRSYRVSHVRMTATSAVRDAENRDECLSLCHDIFMSGNYDIYPELISGYQEAELSFNGAVQAVPEIKYPVLVCDLGGGSTELAIGDHSGMHTAYSMDIGCVRITEKFLHSNPPHSQEISYACDYIDSMITTAIAQLEETAWQSLETWIGVAGTFTTLAAVALGLDRYDRHKIHGVKLNIEEFAEKILPIVHSSYEERAQLSVISQGRIDVIGAGALIVSRLIHWIRHNTTMQYITISEHDILDGIVYSILP